MAALSIRDLDDSVRDALRLRAAASGRSMEAEVRSILEAAVAHPAPLAPAGVRELGLGRALLEVFSDGGGVDLELPARDDVARLAVLPDVP